MRLGRSGAHPLSTSFQGFGNLLHWLLYAAANTSKTKCALWFEAVLGAGIAVLVKSVLFFW